MPCAVCAGHKPEPASGAGDAQAQPEPERPEDAEPTGVRAALLREAAQAGAQPPAGPEAGPGEAEPGSPQVTHKLHNLIFLSDLI